MTRERWMEPAALAHRMRDAARGLRRVQTRSEVILWDAVRGGALDGRKFRRQQPIGPFVVDFFCAGERLVVEVDGGIHAMQVADDQERQAALERLGLRFLRFGADRVENDFAAVLAEIRNAFAPLSPGGRGAGGEGVA